MIKRHQELFQFLIEKNPCNISDICHYLDISKPTLRRDIEHINEEISDYKVSILYLDNGSIGFNDLSAALKLLKIIDSFIEMSLTSQMQLYLILKNQTIPLQEIADDLYVSKSKIVNVANQLLNFSAGLVHSSRNGYYFVDNLKIREEVFISLLAPYFKGNNFEEEYRLFCLKQFDLAHYISTAVVVKAAKEATRLKENSEMVKDHLITKLFLSNIFGALQYDTDEQSSAHLLIDSLSQAPESVENQAHHQIIQEMLASIDHFLGTSFSLDTDLIKGLMNHIDFTWKEYGDQIGPIESLEFMDMKKQYPLSYESAVIASQHLSDKYAVKFDTNDLTYLTIHFQNSLEKKKRKKTNLNTIILTPYGLTAGKLIDNQLSQQFENIHTVDITSYSDFLFKEYEEPIDLVLSLSYIEDCPFPVIYLPLVLTDSVVREIDRFIKNKKYNYLIEAIMNQALIIEKDSITSPHDGIELMSAELAQVDAIDQEYLASVIERESLSSTALKGIAVPHGNIRHVKQNRLAILKLTKPVQWQEFQVDWIFMLAITEETMKANTHFFNNFYRVVAKNMFYISLCKLREENDLSQLRQKLFDLFTNLLEEFT